MILTAKNEQGKTIFRDKAGDIFYAMTDSPVSCQGSSAEFARELVKEAMKLNVAQNNPTTSGYGWAGSMLERFEHRRNQLQSALMSLCIDETITLHIKEKQNDGK